MKVLDLFSGIGGFSLGLERAGMATCGFCEIDPFCRRVLAKHWPNVWIHDDVRTLCRRVWMNNPTEDYENDGWLECSIHAGQDFSECPCVGTDQFLDEVGPVDLICGGFPCQPVSVNGKKKAQDDERWLWPEIGRIVCELRPEWLLLENVPGLLERGMADVLGDLARIGYDAEWDCIPAAAFGAPHLRERVFVVAYPAGKGPQGEVSTSRVWGRGMLTQCDRWNPEPGVSRMGHGVRDRVDRIRSLGNSVIPQIVEHIGRAIMEAHGTC